MARLTNVIGVIDATGSEFTYDAITITATATKIPTTNLNNRKAISIFNMSKDAEDVVYLGGGGVTTANGYPLQPSQGLPFDLASGAQIWGIVAAGKSVEIRYLEVDNG